MRKYHPKVKIIIFSLVFIIFIFFTYLWSFIFSYDAIFVKYNPLLFTDVARIEPEIVIAINEANTTEQIQLLIKDAYVKWIKVSVAGSRHSQWWHTYYKDNLVIDMRQYNKVVSLDVDWKLLTVQAWAKWSDVQEYLNPHGLAVKVMQSSNIFTVWWTLSANAHGRDVEMTSVVESVESFRLLTAAWDILQVSRESYPDLFSWVIGWYGVFGIILDVTIHLTKNDIYTQKADVINTKDLPEYFYSNVHNNTWVAMILARPSIDQNTFFDELVVSKWLYFSWSSDAGLYTLTQEKNIVRDKFFFWLSRKYTWAKDLRWYLQKKVELAVGDSRIMSRNNSMRPPLAPLEFLEYYSKDDTDIIQEYYIPISSYKSFIEDFKRILTQNDVNILSFTIRYVKANNETLLSYCPKEDCFAIIFMANVWLDPESQNKITRVTQEIVDSAIKNHWTNYLTYQLYVTPEQIRLMYPRFDEYIALKKKYDPSELFINKFYKKYEKK